MILHPKFGLNPTMPICLICEKETGTIAMLGNAYKGEAPKNMIVDIEPCDTCRNNYLVKQKGVLLVEVKREFEQGKSKPTEFFSKNLIVIHEKAFKDVFNQEVPKNRIVKCEVGILQKLREISEK